MSEATESESEELSVPRKVIRTVTPPYIGRPDAEMDTIGWTIFLGMVILLVPLLPFIAIVWAFSKAIEAVQGRRA